MNLFENNLDLATKAFKIITQSKPHSFGALYSESRGICDNNNGVQWNIAVDKNLECRLGVNLEGLKYNNWPIAAFIENELAEPELPRLSDQIDDNANILISMLRDAWQVRARPPILEKIIGGKNIALNNLSAELWKNILIEAYKCLNKAKCYRGRATQEVTLTRSGKRFMQVSPHLYISKLVWHNTPFNLDMALTLLQESFDTMQNIYEFVLEKSKAKL